jgi:hypothetical protein
VASTDKRVLIKRAIILLQRSTCEITFTDYELLLLLGTNITLPSRYIPNNPYYDLYNKRSAHQQLVKHLKKVQQNKVPSHEHLPPTTKQQPVAAFIDVAAHPYLRILCRLNFTQCIPMQPYELLSYSTPSPP